MKKLIPLLLIFAAIQSAYAQKTAIDSLQAMPEKLFTKGNILNCSVQGYRKAYLYRFLFRGTAKPVRASLRHEMTTGVEYPWKMESEAFNKRWYSSPDVATYLQDWTFEITPSRDSLNFGEWAEGINPGGATDMMYTHLPGGHFFIAKGMDTAAHKHWKISIGNKAISYDSTWVDKQYLPVNNNPAVQQELDEAKNQITLTVYNFANKTEIMGIAQWGDLFFPFYYGYRNREQPQFSISSIQVGF